MNRKLDLIVSNPSGNTTLLVLTPADRKDYQEISDKLLAIDFGKKYGISFESSADTDGSLFGEQVAFVMPDDTGREYPAMEMSGLEFCGNASRAFAYYTVHRKCKGNKECKSSPSVSSDRITTTINVSGCDYPINTFVDLAGSQVEIEMPVPIDMMEFSFSELGLTDADRSGILVDLDGISHLVLEGVKASQDIFHKLKAIIYAKVNKPLPAFGVMFLDSISNTMTPVVYVQDVYTTYFEGSCASGTTAASCALAAKADDGIHNYTFRQPAGTLYTTVTKQQGEIRSVNLSGLMEQSPVITVEI